MTDMFEKLMGLPLFQGASRDKLKELVEKIPFHFLKYEAGDVLLSPGEKCTHIKFVVSGSVEMKTDFSNYRVSLLQTINSPGVIGPEFMFGRKTIYPYTCVAKEACGILQIKKADYVDILMKDKVFLFNMLNYLSRNAQKSTLLVQNHNGGIAKDVLALVSLMLTTADSDDIKLNYRQKDLCAMLGISRLSLKNHLDELVELGAIAYGAGNISVLNRKLLLTHLGFKEV